MSEQTEQATGSTSRSDLEARLIARSMRDEAFRQELLSDPRGVVQRELGVFVPEGIDIQVHEESPTSLHLVLPAAAGGAGSELSDEELEQVAGGKSDAKFKETPSCDGYCASGTRG